MKIKTNRPVYSYAEGGGFLANFGEKFKEFKDSGKLKELGSTLGQLQGSGILSGLFKGRNRNQPQQQMQQQMQQTLPPPPPPPKKMSQNTKILIGVGAGIVILGIVYMISKKNAPVVLTK